MANKCTHVFFRLEHHRKMTRIHGPGSFYFSSSLEFGRFKWSRDKSGCLGIEKMSLTRGAKVG